jgi:hypothetical protein
MTPRLYFPEFLLLAFRLLYDSTVETFMSEVRELPPFGLVFVSAPQ